MPELMGEEGIDWDDFTVTDAEAPEYQGQPTVEQAEVTPAPAEDGGHGDVDLPAPEDTVQSEGRPRDPNTGQFLSAEEVQRREAEQQQEPVRPPDDPLVAEYLAKYGGDMAAAVRAAAHQSDVLGRQGVEVGELRQQMSEMLEQMNRPRPVAPDYDAVFAEDPALAADQAIINQDPQAYTNILQQWREFDPSQVRIYEGMKEAQYRAHMAEQRAESLAGEQNQAKYGSVLDQAWLRVAQEIPDLPALAQAMREEAVATSRAAGGASVYSQLLQSGDPEQAYQALRTLALAASYRTGDVQRQRVVDLARTNAAETQRAKNEAVVASGTHTAPEPQRPQTYDDELLAEFQAEDKRRDGWHVGST